MYYAVEYANGKPILVYKFKTQYGRELFIKMQDGKDIRNVSPMLAQEYIADKIRYEEF